MNPKKLRDELTFYIDDQRLTSFVDGVVALALQVEEIDDLVGELGYSEVARLALQSVAQTGIMQFSSSAVFRYLLTRATTNSQKISA